MPHVSIENPFPTPKTIESPFVSLGRFSRVIESEMGGYDTVGDFSCVTRSWLGKYVGVNAYSFISDCEVGRYCTFGSRVSVGAFSHPTDWLSVHEFQYRDISKIYGQSLIKDGRKLLGTGSRPTKIGSDVWVGDNAAVGRGVSIGHGSIIGLGAVVVKDVEPYSIVVGNPGRTLRKRFPDEIVAILLDLKWWEQDMAALEGIDFSDINAALNTLKARLGR